jgi:hypothetical protein
MSNMLEIQGKALGVQGVQPDGVATLHQQGGESGQASVQANPSPTLPLDKGGSRAGWETGSKLKIPASAQSWTLIVLEDLVEAQAFFDTNIGAFYWRAVIGDIPVGQGECVTLEEAQEEAEQTLWGVFEKQRDFWFEAVESLPVHLEKGEAEPEEERFFFSPLVKRQALDDLKSPDTLKGVVGDGKDQ